MSSIYEDPLEYYNVSTNSLGFGGSICTVEILSFWLPEADGNERSRASEEEDERGAEGV